MTKQKIKVAVGMSGGVDSSVSALLLKQAGYEVVGLFMKLWHDPCGTSQNACCDDKALADAHLVAKKIGIPLYEVDARKEFKEEVTDYFIDEYRNIRTPNPCVVCNKKIKFGWLLDFAQKLGCEKLATGHYARVIDDAGNPNIEIRNPKQIQNSKFKLLKGVDEKKDQSYFLYQLNQDQLSKIIFPVGGMTKPEVRKIAEKNGLPVFEKAESQEVCFVSDNDYRAFLRRYLSENSFKPGKIVDLKGEVIGEHDGLVNYTVGQRKGITQVKSHPSTGLGAGKLKVKSDTTPKYVIGFNLEKNELIVGDDKDLFKKEFEIRDAHWDDESKVKSEKLKVKIRYKAQEVPCSISLIHNSKFLIRLHDKVRATTPGQSAVFYDGDEVIGGGIIQ
ncbi:MAG: tRNA 2-thiouridine(34) synthase MnmA [bacterium]|nr:tRNA 2-thiouridine(34) synthase MnmA [bacterium]